MMDTKIRNFAPLPDLSLEELVPKDNFYRHLDAMLDLSFVGNLVRDCYASSGRSSVAPVCRPPIRCPRPGRRLSKWTMPGTRARTGSPATAGRTVPSAWGHARGPPTAW